MLRIALVIGVLASGCISTSYSTKVRVRDAQQVEIVDKDNEPVSLKDSGIFDGPRTTIQDVARKPDRLPTKDKRYTWRKGNVVASTSTDNIESAAVVTHWNQWHGELPSMLWTVTGSLMAVGFGIAGPATIVEGVSQDPANGNDVVVGSVLTGLAVGGLALATYGVVTWVLVKQGTTDSPLPVE
jgi:hypothetical protein